MNWNKRYASEKTAHDPGIVGPILHGLSEIGHGVGNAAHSLWSQMTNPWTDHNTIDPHVQNLMEQNINNQAILHNGPGVEHAQQALYNYQDANTQTDYHLPGIGADLIGAGSAAFGIKKLKDKLFQRDVDPILDGRQQHLIHDHGFNNLQEALDDYNFIGGRADNKHHLNELHGMDHALGDMGEFHHEHP